MVLVSKSFLLIALMLSTEEGYLSGFFHWDSLDALQSLVSRVEVLILWPASSSVLNLNV